MRLFQKSFHVSDGSNLLGQISTYQNQSITLVYPLRRLIVPKKTEVTIGLELITPDGERFLIADEMVDYGIGSDQRSYTLIRVTEQGAWQRDGVTVDPITGLDKDTSPAPLGTIWYQIRRIGFEEDFIKVPEAKNEIITGAELKPDDEVGPYIILNTEKHLGVTTAQVK